MTLSSAQLAACRRHGLDVHLADARAITPDLLGPFDGVVSLGAFEHFCSPTDYREGRQEAVYETIFARIASLLPDHGRLYLQTMVFGSNMIASEQALAALETAGGAFGRLVSRPTGQTVPRLMASLRFRAGHPLRRAALSSAFQQQCLARRTPRRSTSGTRESGTQPRA